MAKRRPYGPDGDGPRKRPRVVHEAPTSEDILSARQLMQLLAFDQDLQKARHGIQSFKVLLDKLNDPEKHRPENAALLRSYLESSGQRKDDAGDDEGESDPVFLPDIMDTWDFAAKANNDGLMSAVPVVLALLIRYLSHVLDLAPVCLGICRTLLRRRQLEMIAHNLSADKGKEFIISPTLRLLREALTFDGGAIAKPLFRARNFTYRSLARNMSLKFLGDGVEDIKRTSARTNAVRFFLASLKFLHPEAKAELLNQRDTVNALTRTIKDDPPYVVYEILNTLRDHVLKDKKLQRSSRVKLFNAGTLIRLSGLYSYAYENTASVSADGDISADHNKLPVSDTVHQLLLHICTSSAVGVLRDQNGFYPQGVEPNSSTGAAVSTEDDIQLDVGLDGIAWIDKFADTIPVFNLALADFLSNLRPWSSTRQSELAIAIFRGAPELAAWYFIDRKSFTFEPKMSATWVGYAAFLFNAIQAEIPPFFGNKLKYARVPPPTSVLVDNILPRPLTQKVLARCLAQKSKLIPFFAIRLLVIAMEKLQLALQMHREAAQKYPLESLWKDSERRVVDEFCRRCPPMKEIINAYRAIDDEDLMYREAVSRVLRLYYEVVPQVALNSKFDVSPYLFVAVRQVDEHTGSQQDKAVKLMDLENLLAIAGYSPGMQWFSKAKGLAASPFAALLKVYTEATGDLAVGKIRDVLNFVAREQQLFLPDSTEEGQVSAGLAGLFDSLKPKSGSDKQSLLSDPVWAFVDNCVVRCATGPIKYIEMMPSFGGAESFDPVTMAIVEQLRFATENATPETLKKLADFLKKYFESCRGDKKGLESVVERISAAFPNMPEVASQLKKTVSKRKASAKKQDTACEAEGDAPQQSSIKDSATNLAEDVTPSLLDERTLEEVLDLSPIRTYDTAALSKWTTKSVDELVEDGHAAAVVGLLVSSEDSVRRSALVNLTNMAAKMRESAYDEKDQVWLLLSELVESTKAWMTDKETADLPVPSHIVSFTCHALDVLRNPLHCLYAKLNTFLTAGPVWRMRTFPLVTDIVHDGPSEDDSYYTEISWLLAYLIDSLRTPADIDYFRSRRLFETIVSVASNPYMRSPLRRQVLRLVSRVSEIEGGSTTLITRSGIVSWLTAQQAAQPSASTAPTKATEKKRREGNSLDEYEESVAIQALLKRLWETCDRDRVEGWSMHGVQENIGI
ncbi:ribosome biogenesis protein urb1 [Ophiostoma piceae UAMH 11346]|uniref:Ribosome biogenesis protein urb1 n=1 Tax=Ophiostoma piceae (strain UAMH 11346) TaxID=1262450 RepID=S3BY12_OPHP1|nr:ribosome biogenesis protein urb1 [Ophiostoma piceae UAMH 11346]